MSVSLRPSSSLGFNRPLTQIVKRELTLTNNNDQPVAFKVKTTAPRLYCVRPNSGRLDPHSSAEVQVLLQAMKEEPPANAKCKDKFLVQSTIITPEKETMSLHDLWSNVDDKDGTVHQQKIKVIYLPPIGQELPEEDESPSFAGANESRYQTVRDTPNGHHDDSIASQPFPQEQQDVLERAFSPPVGEYGVPAEEAELPSPPLPAPPVVQPAPAAIHHHSSTADDELRSQLAAAQSEIDRLRLLLSAAPEIANSESEGLRRRTRGAFSDAGTTVVSDDGETEVGTVLESAVIHQDGVPPQMVVGIALVVFMLTYIFF